MDKKSLKRLLDVAAGRTPADLCISDCNVVDVFNKEVFKSNVYIVDGLIAGFGGAGFPAAKEIFDANGRYLAPGFIDGHSHIESSHLSPSEFAKLAIPCGTTTVIADPHEICNVCGMDGFDYMLKASENVPMSIFFQLPSCVPCTPFEDSGAVLKAKEIAAGIDNPRVLGLGELMDYVGVEKADSDVLDKIMVAKNAGKIIDGHSPEISGSSLDAYSSVGVINDHECTTGREARDRIRRGMYVMLRQGTGSHDLLNLLKVVDNNNYDRCLMCTDDCLAGTMLETGHIDNNIRIATGAGLDPITAISMATINAANCFRLNDRGAVVPGRRADLVLFSDLKDIRVSDVFAGGKHVASNRRMLVEIAHTEPDNVSGRMQVKDCSPERFALKLKSGHVKTIVSIPRSFVTEIGDAYIERDENGFWKRNGEDIVKVAVVERHHNTGNIGLALIQNFGLKNGAVATSVAHDSHNIIVAGDSDADMSLAVKELIRLGGGMTVVKNGKVLESVQHEIAGLMTDLDGETVAKKLTSIQKTAKAELGIHEDIDPFMTLCFMSLPVIPKLKITDLGLFDVTQFRFTSVEY